MGRASTVGSACALALAIVGCGGDQSIAPRDRNAGTDRDRLVAIVRSAAAEWRQGDSQDLCRLTTGGAVTQLVDSALTIIESDLDGSLLSRRSALTDAERRLERFVAAQEGPDRGCAAAAQITMDAAPRPLRSDVRDVDVTTDGNTGLVLTSDGRWQLTERNGRWLVVRLPPLAALLR